MKGKVISDTEIIEMKTEMKVVEEFLNVDASVIEFEKSKDLIRLEMNIVEFPIFSKNSLNKLNQIRKYYFSADKSSYLEISPSVNTQIPGEVEERVFIALTKILRNNGFAQTFYCTLNDILDNMKIENRGTRNGLYPKVKNAISKMASTTYKFKNLFYSNEKNKNIGDLIETNILNYSAITVGEANENESNFFSDKRTKELYKITLSDHFYSNIIRKGYLAFDADELLSIKDSVTRSVYTMITKWRNNNLYLKKQAYFIARRIPLAWDKNPRRTILRIEKSLEELKEFKYIKDFNLVRKDKWDKAEFEMFFDESHNVLKRNTFFDEKQNFDKMVHLIEDRQNEVSVNNIEMFNDPKFTDILETFPDVARKFKSLPSIIREALKKYDYQFVKYTAEYTSLNCKASYIKYFKDALLNNWAEQYIVKKETLIEKKSKKKKNIIEEAILVEEVKEPRPNATWEEYLIMDNELQVEIEATAYENFLMESGSAHNKIMRSIFEKSKKSFILKIVDNYSFDKVVKSENKEEKLKEPIINKISVEEIKIENKVNETYASFSHFLLAVNKFVAVNNIVIDLSEVISIFKLLGEYEDFNIKFSYNESTKVGEIIKK